MPETTQPSRVVEVFFSYARQDENLCQELVKQLRVLEQNGMIKVSHASEILPGQERNSKISAALEKADIILLLVSADFISSDYCYGREMIRAIERDKAKEAYLIPVILRPCDWEDAPFGSLKALPGGAKPCTQWTDIDAAFLDVTNGLKPFIRALKGEVDSLETEIIDEAVFKDGNDRAQEDMLSLLPYLCDRTPQEDDLTDALMRPLPRQSMAPFLCIIYGSEEECHDKFRERLQVRTLRSILGESLQPFSILDIMLQLPSNVGRLAYASEDEEREAFFRVLERNLAKKVLGKPGARTQEIIEAVSQFKNPIIIHSGLSTAAWEPHGPKIVSWFLDFWNDSWGGLAGPHLFICFHIEFDRKREEFIPHEQKVRDFLAGLELTKYGNLNVACLSELDAVPDDAAKEWVRDEENFEGFCKVHSPNFCDVQDVVNEIITLYKQPESVNSRGCISMLSLAPKLKHLVKTYYCQRSTV
jgi:hypothetical protein